MRRRRLLQAAPLALAWQLGPRTALGGQWLATPELPDVPLTDHLGREVDLLELISRRPVVVNFFFTGCATVCPPQTALLQEARRQWRTKPALARVLVVSISVDPLGDGPKQLQAYAERFGVSLGEDKGWVMLTGAAKPMARVLDAFDVPVGQADDHPALLWLGDRSRGRWTRTSSLNPPATLTRQLEALLS
ncbi:MAG: SCO family protein [Hydrogenophaga sp.]|nr:SCO family protein [Hydrogenophaga sp.]